MGAAVPPVCLSITLSLENNYINLNYINTLYSSYNSHFQYFKGEVNSGKVEKLFLYPDD